MGPKSSADSNRLLLVHGAFHGAWCWDRLLPELSRRGVRAETVELPLTSVTDDEAAISRAAQALLAVDESLVVAGHSYGGTPMTGAQYPRRGLERLVYIASVMMEPTIGGAPPLEAASSLRESERDRGVAVVHHAGRSRIDPGRAGPTFYNQCTPADVEWATTRLRDIPTSLFGMSPSRAAWREVPTTYVLCTDDRILPPAVQRQHAHRADEVIEIDSDHSPFLSHPGTLADVLTGVMRSPYTMGRVN